MVRITAALALAAMLGFAAPATADRVFKQHGSDTFLSGAQIDEALDAGGDAFAAGRSLRLRGDVGGDLHVSGFDVTVGTDTAEDLYAAGATVVISGAVASDLTVAGFTVRTDSSSVTTGNARLFGNTVTIDGPVSGALAVTGRDVILNAPIAGDVRVLAQTLTFGPKASVGGMLTYSTQSQVAVPERVAPAARVVFEEISGARVWEEWDDIGDDMPMLPSFASVVFGFVVSLLFYVAVGALALGFMPRQLSRLRHSVTAAPGQTLVLGVIGLSMLFGMVPITALTIVGLPFVPIVLLVIVVAWTLGYALGAYCVAMRVWAGFGGADDPSSLARLLVFAAAITCVALLNFIPFVGWVANYTLVLLGMGAMTRVVFQLMIGNPGLALDVDMRPLED